jgi:PHD/YefM family antitoxin component YafN of YafNO toxin-antitoxin module
VPIDEYEGLEETAEILSDPVAVRAIQKGLADRIAASLRLA